MLPPLASRLLLPGGVTDAAAPRDASCDGDDEDDDSPRRRLMLLPLLPLLLLLELPLLMLPKRRKDDAFLSLTILYACRVW